MSHTLTECAVEASGLSEPRGPWTAPRSATVYSLVTCQAEYDDLAFNFLADELISAEWICQHVNIHAHAKLCSTCTNCAGMCMPICAERTRSSSTRSCVLNTSRQHGT